jgi:hypothetical protein
MRMGQAKARKCQAGDVTATRAVARSRLLHAALATAAGVLCALAWTGSASALVHRGHVFGSTFEGTGEQAFAKATGVAVNEKTGEVYVVDTPRERVERFKPEGSSGFKFVGEFSVPNPAGIAIDNDTSSPSFGDVYVPGIEKAPKKGEAPEEEERNWLYKYTASGEKIYKRQESTRKEKIVNEAGESETEEFETFFEDISGVSVDATGKLWVYFEEEGKVAGYTSDEHNKLIGTSIKEDLSEENFECRALLGFAVAPSDEAFYLRHERGTGVEECPEEEALPEAVANALIGKVNGAGVPITNGLTAQNSTGVAVDESSGDVYVDNATSIAAFTGDGTAIERFGSGNLTGGGALAVDHATEQVFAIEGGDKVAVFEPEETGASPSIDSVAAQVESATSAALVAKIDGHGEATTYTFQFGTASCVSDPGSCSTVSGELPANFGDQVAEAKLEGLLPDTPYYYRVVAENSAGKGESAEFAKTFFTTLPSAEGLLANHREWEMVSPPAKAGPLDALSLEGAAFQSAEGGNSFTYGAENSGPAGEEVHGNRSVAVTQFLSTRGDEGWSTQDITTPHNQGEGLIVGAAEEYHLFSPDLSLGLVEPEDHSSNSPLCEAPPLAPPNEGETCEGAPGLEKTLYLRANAPVEPEAAESAAYESASAKPNKEYLAPGYLPLITGANNDGEVEGKKTHFGHSLEFIDATPDLQHVVVESAAPLAQGATGTGLYQWNFNGGVSTLQLVSVLQGAGEKAEPAVEPQLGGWGNTRHAIATDGLRTIFSSEYVESEGVPVNPGAYLYLRDTTTSPARTVQINAVQGEDLREPGEAELEEQLAETRYQTASSDDSKIFFTDTWPLTDESDLHPTESSHPADLYEYDVTTGELTDITVSAHVNSSAEVLGTIPGASEDGSYVYFVANGILAPGATQGSCPNRIVTPSELAALPPGATCNLYLSQPKASNSSERETRFIAALSAQDDDDWGLPANNRLNEGEADLTYVTSRVSPGSGEYLAFMSQRELTGYDNVDAVSGKPDEEVYLYDAKTGRLDCASCNPSGAQPQGVFDQEKSGEGLGLLVDRPEAWLGHWLAGSIPGWTSLSKQRSVYQSRYLDADGRLFFDSADPLVAQDQNSKEDVYEYEPQGINGCEKPAGCVALISSGAKTDGRESAFLDSSATGNDVFFLTSEKLSPRDTDGSFDVYDARVCGTSESGPCLPPVAPPPAPCQGEGCKAGAPTQPGVSTPASASFSGPGNAPATGVLPSKKAKAPAKKPLTRAQKLSKALQTCRKHFKHSKKKRASCEKQARKKYGVKKAKAKKSDSSDRRRA